MIIYRFILCITLLSFINICNASQQLIIEPDMGKAPLLNAIQQSQRNIDVVMYGFTDLDFADALIKAQQQEKHVRVLLQHYPYKALDENQKVIRILRHANINMVWPDDDFKLTHQKTFLLDRNKAIVMTFNLTHSTFKKERNFALVITEPAEVQEIQSVFDHDWQHKAINVHQVELVWSPDNAREKILSFINSAQSTIHIYAEGLSDYQVIGLLAKAARRGIHVNIITSPPREGNKINRKWDFLRAAGVNIVEDHEYWIHAKVIIIDDKKALLGSINLTRASINDNRELSVITSDATVVAQLVAIFKRDWKHANAPTPELVTHYRQQEFIKLFFKTSKQLAHLLHDKHSIA